MTESKPPEAAVSAAPMPNDLMGFSFAKFTVLEISPSPAPAPVETEGSFITSPTFIKFGLSIYLGFSFNKSSTVIPCCAAILERLSPELTVTVRVTSATASAFATASATVLVVSVAAAGTYSPLTLSKNPPTSPEARF